MPFRDEYNGCKTYGCPNCGQPDLTQYSISNQLGYNAWYCPECGAYPPVLLNQPIIALAKQVQSRQRDYAMFPACACHIPLFQRYGFTASGSQRIKCTQCHQLITLANPQKMANKLQPIMDALANQVRPESIQRICELNNKAFIQSIDLLSRLVNHVSHSWEKTFNFSVIQTRTNRQWCRSGARYLNHKPHALHLWTVSSADSDSGYMILISDNALYDGAFLDSDVLKESSYRLNNTEQLLKHDLDVFTKAERTYEMILGRSQFDQIAYCQQFNAQSKEVDLLRPVYAAHAHFQNLSVMLEQAPAAIILEHESFLRGAAITAFNTAIKCNETNLYYCHLTRADLEQESSKSIHSTATKTMSWWHEKWHRSLIETSYGHWHVGIGVLTQEMPHMTRLFRSNTDWNQYFWDEFNEWLTPKYAQRISLKRLHQWQSIYKYLYNFIFTDRLHNKTSGMDNPTDIAALVQYMLDKQYFNRH